MPTYEYECESCGHKFDAFQSIKDNPLKICPICNSKVHRVISGGAGLIFKGSGFYITDYKKSSNDNGKSKHHVVKSDTSNKDSSDEKSDSTE